MKKTLIFTIIFLLIVGLVAGFWLYKKDRDNSPASQVSEVKDTSTINPWYVTDGQAISPALSLDGLSVWYFDGVSRELMRQNLQDANDLKKYPLSENKDIRFALWPNKGSDFIIGGADGYKAY
ncbi:MAG TPA: hypothetical protein VEA37_01415, partial [Flavobacterium sp.]|nr:hypothetical protein [Flavobacterium sp.]